MTNLYTDPLPGKDLTQRKHKDLQQRLESHVFANITFYEGWRPTKLMYLVFSRRKLRKHIDEISDDWHTLISSIMSISHLVLTCLTQFLNFIKKVYFVVVVFMSMQ